MDDKKGTISIKFQQRFSLGVLSKGNKINFKLEKNEKIIILSLILSFNILSNDHHSMSNHNHTSAEWQIKTYSSAAPSSPGDFATVIGGNGEFSVGTIGWIRQHGNPNLFRNGLEISSRS